MSPFTMAEFLRSTQHIISKIEETVTQCKEFLYILSPVFSQMPRIISTRLWEAKKRGVKVIFIYREVKVSDELEMTSLQDSRISVFHSAHLNTNAYFNEKEGVLTSFSLFAHLEPNDIEFGTYFRKVYAADMHAELLKEFRNILGYAVKMIIDEGKLVSEEDVVAEKRKLQEIKVAEEDVPSIPSTKILTVKEKQDVILKLFTRECKDCTIKVEDAERIRVVGKGIVLVLAEKRVDMIFVHYDTFQSRLEEIKEFITTKHPNLKAWFQYNRINMEIKLESEILSVFFTIREAVNSFSLV